MKRSRESIGLAILACVGLAVLPGCVRRRLTVRTNPPGALVSVDNQIIGTSPAASSFVYYGTREFRVERDGYRTETIRQNITPPWYQYPVIDFFSETLWPFEVRDERIIDIEMVPQQIASTEEVLGRANGLREQSRQGVVTAPNISVVPPSAIPSIPLSTNGSVSPNAAASPNQGSLPFGGQTLP